VDDFPGMLKEDFAGHRQRDLALGPVEQFDAKFLFQPADRCREGRLHNVYPLGGPGEVQLGGHGDEVLQVAKFHVAFYRVSRS
jgi:hypothetical protein